MVTGHDFKQLKRYNTDGKPPGDPTVASFLRLVYERVLKRFEWVSDFETVLVPLDLPGFQQSAAAQQPPANPACAAYTRTDACRHSWQAHLSQLSRNLQTCWHVCHRGRYCALIPIVASGRCLAAIKFVTAASITLEEFEDRIEVFDILVQDFVRSEKNFLSRVDSHRTKREAAATLDRRWTVPRESPTAVHVQNAIDHIENHFTDSQLNLASIAQELKVHPDYLSKLFVEQIGIRIKQYLSELRVDKAKNMLRNTDWQVKCIARKTGHSNAHWFSHLFKVQTGHTPLEYRRRMRESDDRSSPRNIRPT